jgi:hypothetical protein
MQSACLKGARNGLIRCTTVLDWRPRQGDGQTFWSTGDGAELQVSRGYYIGGHSRDRISYPLATSVTCMTTLLTLQAMHSNSAFMAPSGAFVVLRLARGMIRHEVPLNRQVCPILF